MHVCVVQMWGLGNAVLMTPLCQALKQMGRRVDVLVENGRAAKLVFEQWSEVVDHIWEGSAPKNILYDFALFGHDAQPYISRVRCSLYDDLKIPKPFHPRGYMWSFEKHEVEYIMDMAHRHGFRGVIPPLRVPLPPVLPSIPTRSAAIGIGYLKDNVAWEAKHWGNVSYAELAIKLYESGITPILVGGPDDVANAAVIEKIAPVVLNTCGKLTFPQTTGLIKQCLCYIGNDSGLMHVAAAVSIPTIGIFRMTNPTKNRPWCEDWVVLSDPQVAVAHAAVLGFHRSAAR